MIRVRSPETGEQATIGVCPGAVLLLKLAKMGFEVASDRDGFYGTYLERSGHAPACPYRG